MYTDGFLKRFPERSENGFCSLYHSVPLTEIRHVILSYGELFHDFQPISLYLILLILTMIITLFAYFRNKDRDGFFLFRKKCQEWTWEGKFWEFTSSPYLGYRIMYYC